MDKKVVLHLSHTDIRYDARIAKEIKVLVTSGRYDVTAVGIKNDEGNATAVAPSIGTIHTLSLATRNLKRLPRPLRLVLAGPLLVAMEFSYRMVIIGRRVRPSIVHCHDTFALPAGLVIKALTGCRLIYDAHELESNKNGQNKFTSAITYSFERFSWCFVDVFVSVSESIITWYNRSFGAKESVLILNSPEGADGPLRPVSHRGDYFNKKFDIPTESPIFIYVGLLMPGRGIDQYLEAFSGRDSQAHLVFLGYGQLTDKIRSFAEKNPRVHYHPAVPHRDVVGIITNADVGLCLIENISLSDYYSLPNKLFEYAFAGIAILGSDFPEIRRVVSGFQLGEVTANDVASLRRAIKYFNTKSTGRVICSLNDLTWAKQAERLLLAYGKC